MEPHVINGKKGYYLKIPQFGNWLLEPQVDLGPDKGVRVGSRADFVLHPEKPVAGELPIAVFTDGFEYHADPENGNMRTGKDSAQRLAIARSGKYRVWSLTWADVQERMGQAGEPQWSMLGEKRLGSQTSFDLLLSLLTSRRETGFAELAWNVAMDGLVANRQNGVALQDLAYSLQALPLAAWPPAQGAPVPGWFCGVLNTDYLAGFLAVAQEDIADKSFRRLRVWLRLLDDRAQRLPTWRSCWREFLRVGNLVQFLPEAAFMTTRGLMEGLYGSLLDTEAPEVAKPSGAAIEMLLADVIDDDARKIFIAIDQEGLILPVPGFEITNADGETRASMC